MTAAKMLSQTESSPTGFGKAIVSARPALQRHALRLTRDRVAAEDLVQDTLMRAWGARMRFQAGTNMNAWLFSIARNAFLSGVRRSRRDVAWDPDRHNPLLVQAATQDDALYARDFRAASTRLAPDQRRALMLIAQEGLSIADAADELGVPPGTVKSRVSRARATMLAYVGGVAPSIEAPAPDETGDRVTTIPPIESRELPQPPPRTRYEQWKASGATTIG